MSVDTTANWANGQKTVYAKVGGTNTASGTVAVPAVSGTTWTNTTGRTWRADITIGGTTRQSGTKDFGSYFSDGQAAAGLTYSTSAHTISRATSSDTKVYTIGTTQGDWSSGSKTVSVNINNVVNGLVTTTVTIPNGSISLGGWSSGSNSITASTGGKTIATSSVSIPSISSAALNGRSAGNVYNLNVTIGGTTKSTTVNCIAEYERGWNDYRAELLKAAYANGNTYLYYGDWAGTLYRPPNNSYVEYNYCVYNATGFYIPAAK